MGSPAKVAGWADATGDDPGASMAMAADKDIILWSAKGRPRSGKGKLSILYTTEGGGFGRIWNPGRSEIKDANMNLYRSDTL